MYIIQYVLLQKDKVEVSKVVYIDSSVCLSVTIEPGGHFGLRSGGFKEQARLSRTELRRLETVETVVVESDLPRYRMVLFA